MQGSSHCVLCLIGWNDSCLGKAGPEPWAMSSLWMYVSSWGENRWLYCVPSCCDLLVLCTKQMIRADNSVLKENVVSRTQQRVLCHQLLPLVHFRPCTPAKVALLVIVHVCARRGCVNLMFPFLPVWFSKAFKPFMLRWVKMWSSQCLQQEWAGSQTRATKIIHAFLK